MTLVPAQALQMSMLDVQQHSEAANLHTAQETNLSSMLPKAVRHLPEECASALLLVCQCPVWAATMGRHILTSPGGSATEGRAWQPSICT